MSKNSMALKWSYHKAEHLDLDNTAKEKIFSNEWGEINNEDIPYL
jgi:hypothetical protein